MIWSNVEFLNQLEKIVPFKEHRDLHLVNSASLDVRFGNEIKLERKPTVDVAELRDPLSRPSAFGETKILEPDEVYWLEPGEIVLVSMLEKIVVPKEAATLFLLKSSRAREGFEHANAGWIDPGWDGILTMEIKNNLRYNKIPVFPNFRIGQLVYFNLVSESSKPYNGRYQNSDTVEASKPKAYDVR